MRKRLFIIALIIVIGIGAHVSFNNMGEKLTSREDEVEVTKKLEDTSGESEEVEMMVTEVEKGGIEVEKTVVMDRNDIDSKYKWNLKDIYEGWEAWEADLDKAKVLMGEIPEYKGKIKEDSKNFIDVMMMEEELSKLVDKIYLYPYMMRDLDSTDSVASSKLQGVQALLTQYSASTAWVTPEILEIPEETMTNWIDENKELEDYRFSIMEIYRLQEHVLEANEEKLLSYYGQYMGAPTGIYKELTTSDIKWNEIELSTGEKVSVTNGQYSKILGTSRNQKDRKKAFEALYSSYDDNKNTYAAIYRSILQKNYAATQARNYDSVLSRALEGNNIPTEVYENLIKVTRENTEPLQRYTTLRKRLLGIENYHYYDNQINLVDYTRRFEYDEARDIVLESIKPLGDMYEQRMETAIGEGWLDVYETEGKRSGAYSLGVYGVHPYMLLNYTGTLDSVFTLAHELGHTMHSMLSMEQQSYANHRYTIFVAEVASTFNERLLLDYMLETTTDPVERIALIEQALGNIVGTYYIQTLFADYEYQASKLIEEGKAVTPEVLDEIMENLFKAYFGDTVVIDDLQKIIWTRIPHFYNSPFYVYQYATCFASSAVLYDKITNEEYSEAERTESMEKYLTLLKSGGNDHPMEQLKKAGVDLRETEAITAVGRDLDTLLDLLEDEIEKYENTRN